MGQPPINIPTDAPASVRRAFMDVRERLQALTASSKDTQALFGMSAIGQRQGDGAILMSTPGGMKWMDFETFAKLLTGTALYKNLMRAIDDPARFDYLGDRVKALILPDIAEVAAQRGADIQRLDQKLQSAIESFAATTVEVTASIAGAAAGVRQTIFAEANNMRAAAGLVTQVRARLDGFGGGTATVEETMTAVADRATGLEAQWTIKANAGGAFAAIGLAATSSTAGVTDSSIIFVADRMAFVSSSDVIGTGPGEVDPTNPDTTLIPFGVDASGVYINGTVRINAAGQTLNSLAASTGIYVTYTSEFWKVDAAGAAVNTSITLTANLTAGLTGLVTWSKSGAGTAPPTAGTTNTWTINAADQTDDTCTYTATLTSGGTTYTDSVTVVRLRDGSNALTAMLTNEAHTVPALSTGGVVDWTGAGGTMKVYKGTSDISATAAYSIQANPQGLTATINATTGVYAVTAAGSWAAGTDVATLTLRATVGGLTLDKVFTLTKSLAGANGSNGTNGTDGSNGARGAIGNGQGQAYSISDAAWSDGHANRVVRNIVMGESLTTTLASTALNMIADTVTLSNGTTFAQTRYWSGTAWVNAGVVISGNLLVNGTISGSQINGTGMDVGPNHEFQVNKTSGVCSVVKGVFSVASFGNLFDPSLPCITATSTTLSPKESISAIVPSGNTSATAHGVRGWNKNYSTSGLVGPASTSFDFYAELKGAYGPFTGAHDGLLAKGEDTALVEGDIVVDVACVGRSNVSNTIFAIAGASSACQRGVIGVVAGPRAALDPESPPNALIVARESETTTIIDEGGDEREVSTHYYVLADGFDALADAYDRVSFNALGEGQMNVCGRGGDIAQGDYLCASSLYGKGMRQAPFAIGAQEVHMQVDYTVAKARESVVFDHPDQVKTIAVTYHCG